MHLDFDHQLIGALDPDEKVQATARAQGAVVAVSERRLLVAEGDRIALKIRLDQVRRIEFDIDKGRPVTLIIVPENPGDEPQVLAVSTDQIRPMAAVLVFIALRLGGRPHG
jgi:hypothetical protein